MKNLSLIIITVFIFFLGSCNITQEYTFNEDMSGTSSLEIDMSAMIEMLGEMDSLGNNNNPLDTISKSFGLLVEDFEKLGATNVKFGDKNNKTIVFLSYDFKDIATLNKILASDGSNMLGSNFMGDSTTKKPKFIKKRKRILVYEAPQVSNDSLFNNKEIESMKDYYNYTLKFNFSTKIKRVKNKKAEISSDNRSFKFSGSMFDILAPGYSTSFKVKLKRK